ncbi:MAG: thiamine-binding protein [Bacteroidota bacterium]
MKINAAIQLLPLETDEHRYAVIDRAIALIEASGLKFKVCPFETVVEGESEEVYLLIQKIQKVTLEGNCSEMLLNIKIHAANRDLEFDDKIAKFQ